MAVGIEAALAVLLRVGIWSRRGSERDGESKTKERREEKAGTHGFLGDGYEATPVDLPHGPL
jgi:hypothetical protein